LISSRRIYAALLVVGLLKIAPLLLLLLILQAAAAELL